MTKLKMGRLGFIAKTTKVEISQESFGVQERSSSPKKENCKPHLSYFMQKSRIPTFKGRKLKNKVSLSILTPYFSSQRAGNRLKLKLRKSSSIATQNID